jgi:hypothetical protein
MVVKKLFIVVLANSNGLDLRKRYSWILAILEKRGEWEIRDKWMVQGCAS